MYMLFTALLGVLYLTGILAAVLVALASSDPRRRADARRVLRMLLAPLPLPQPSPLREDDRRTTNTAALAPRTAPSANTAHDPRHSPTRARKQGLSQPSQVDPADR